MESSTGCSVDICSAVGHLLWLILLWPKSLCCCFTRCFSLPLTVWHFRAFLDTLSQRHRDLGCWLQPLLNGGCPAAPTASARPPVPSTAWRRCLLLALLSNLGVNFLIYEWWSDWLCSCYSKPNAGVFLLFFSTTSTYCIFSFMFSCSSGARKHHQLVVK